jgi:hypothetical protein
MVVSRCPPKAENVNVYLRYDDLHEALRLRRHLRQHSADRKPTLSKVMSSKH